MYQKNDLREGEGLSLDVLRKVEVLSSQFNEFMAQRGKSIFHRYPLTFSLLTLFSVIAVSEGAKGIMESLGFTEHPTYLFLAGLLVLIIIGRLYKKLR